MIRGDALHILRHNQKAIATMERTNTALRAGILAELTQLCKEERDPAKNFRSVFGEPLCTPHFAQFCRNLLHNVTDPAVLCALLPDIAAMEDPPADTRTAYLRSAYTDRAFANFSRGIERLSAQYQTSFSASCEEVYYGRCSYCILPIWNAEDGLLASFSRMIAKYDLKIAQISDVATQDGDLTVRYALLRHGLSLFVPQPGMIQLTSFLPDSISLGEFLHACESTGAKVADIAALPLQYSSSSASFHICFHVNEESGAPLLFFLNSVLESFSPDGIYSLEQA